MVSWTSTWTILAVLLVAASRMGDADRFSSKDKFLSEIAPQLGVPADGAAPPKPTPQTPPSQPEENEEKSSPGPDFSTKTDDHAPPAPPSLQPEEAPKGNKPYDFKLEPAPAGFKPPAGFTGVSEELEEYLSTVDKYGVAGSPVAKNGAFRFPYLASLVLKSAHHCTATLIAPKILLTAAHCVDARKVSINKMSVKFFRYEGSREYAQSIAVEKVKMHPQYRRGGGGNNIALVKLASAPSSATTVRYMGQGDLNLDSSERFISLGWGRISRFSAFAEKLQEVYMPVVNRRRCARAMMKRIPSTEFCAGMEGRGPCLGDDGGPLIRTGGKAENDIIVGITTEKVACGNRRRPDVFTRVSDFTGWIIAEKDNL
ncbi:hypothetical protein BSKO_09297 [Bryopsis sp. KO-2023]|nr:hypothetical protein BSKO_09297 [Bryopsis sp. KO-2023]